LDDNGPTTRPTSQPLTRLQKQQGYAIILVFVVWFPVYLVWVRPIFNRWAFQYVDSYPAELHVVPVLALPLLAAFGYEKFMMWRSREPR
jgi:hypothetical protein